jgi:hypothetical protein
MAKDTFDSQSEWSDPHTITIVDNQPPGKPIIVKGPTSGNPRTLMHFTFSAEDPEGNDVSYLVSWGDGDYEPWTELKPSGSEVTFSHAWREARVYTINVKVKDQYEAKGPQASFSITITKNKAVNNIVWFQIFNKLVDHFPILKYIIERGC